MPRNISFSLTTEQFKNKSKTVTRRIGWLFLKPGDLVMGCKKCMGLKPGEKLERLGLIRIKSVRREPLSAITDDDVTLEGYPDKTAKDFMCMFVIKMKISPKQMITRIEYEYLQSGEIE